LTLLKTFVVCLVLANVCFFLWDRGISKSAANSVPVATNTLKLASEAPGPHAPTESAAPPGAAAPSSNGGGTPPHEEAGAALMTNVKRCISIGPFRDMSETAHAASTLRSGGYDPRQRVADGEVWAGVWVYLPLPVAREAADKMLAKLKAGGFDDALEMPGPGDVPVVSLGLYADQKRAQSRIAQAQGMGFNPGIADRKRSGDVYWIDIDLKPTDSLLNPSDLQGQNGRIVRLEVKGCPSVGGAP
jgi:SPOR domain